MARIRKLAQKDYTVIDNQIIRDETLSWKAKGVFAYLWSMPDDWDFYETEVMKHAKDGRDSLRSAIKELQDAGYMRRQRTRNDKGQVKTSDWELLDKPMLEKPTQEKPMQGDPTLPSTNELSTDVPSTDGTNDDDDTTTRTNVFDDWSNLWGFPNAVARPELDEWLAAFSPEVIAFAIQVAGEHDVQSYGALKYMRAVITGWQERKITTLEQAKKAAEEHDKRRANRKKPQRHVQGRKEVQPKWAQDQATGKKAKPKQLTEKQREELAARLEKLESKKEVV